MTSRRDFAKLLALGGYAALHARSGEAWQPPALSLEPGAARDEGFWADVKAQFLVPRSVAVLNAANLCPASTVVVDAVVNAQDLEHDLSPANRARFHEAREATRRALAEFLRVSPDEIVITRNTSESNNLVSSGLNLAAGDAIVVFADNHPSNLRAWQEKARRFSWSVEVLAQPNPHPGPDYYLEAFRKALSPRTRVLAFSHLTNTVGDLLPARELCRAAREHGVLSAVDGAQSFGLMDVDLSQMQPDFYSGSAHKWLCGPKEAGVLYVRREAQPRIAPSVISAYPGAVGISKTLEGMGQRDDAGLAGFGEAARFQERLGRAAIEARSRSLAQQLQRGLREIPGVKVWTSDDPQLSHAVVSCDPAGVDPHALQEALYAEDQIVCATRTGSDRPGLRFSPHFYNNPSEIERVLAALRRAVRGRA